MSLVQTKPDRNLRSFSGPQGGAVFPSDSLDGTDYDDALKLSNVSDARFDRWVIIGGREDCIDINRGADISVADAVLAPTGRYAATIKGGARNVILTGNLLHRGRSTDVELGNWSDQSQALTRNVRLRLVAADGRPVRVRVWHAEPPITLGPGRYRVQIVPRPLVWAWFTFRRLLGKIVRK